MLLRYRRGGSWISTVARHIPASLQRTDLAREFDGFRVSCRCSHGGATVSTGRQKEGSEPRSVRSASTTRSNL